MQVLTIILRRECIAFAIEAEFPVLLLQTESRPQTITVFILLQTRALIALWSWQVLNPTNDIFAGAMDGFNLAAAVEDLTIYIHIYHI